MKFSAALPTQLEVEELYEKVQQGNKQAEYRLVVIHKILYRQPPLNRVTSDAGNSYKNALHTMYLHIHRHPSIK